MRSEKFKAIVKELFTRCRKLNISVVFITQCYFRTPKDARLNSNHYILMIDTSPTATITFKKSFDEPIDLQHLRAEH